MPLDSDIPRIRAAITRAADATCAKAATAGKAERDARCPVDTGALLRSGRVQRLDTARWEIREGDGLPDARARYTEYGTSRQAAQPHMGPAATVAARVLRQAAAALVGKAVRS